MSIGDLLEEAEKELMDRSCELARINVQQALAELEKQQQQTAKEAGLLRAAFLEYQQKQTTKICRLQQQIAKAVELARRWEIAYRISPTPRNPQTCAKRFKQIISTLEDKPENYDEEWEKNLDNFRKPKTHTPSGEERYLIGRKERYLIGRKVTVRNAKRKEKSK